MDRKINAIGKTDKFGQKWMRCDACKNWEVIQGLHYEKPTMEFKYGRNICIDCMESEFTYNPVKE